MLFHAIWHSEMVALGFTLCNYLPFPHAIGYTKITLQKQVITYTSGGSIVHGSLMGHTISLGGKGLVTPQLSWGAEAAILSVHSTIRPNKLNSQFIVTTSSNFHEGGRSLLIINFWLLNLRSLGVASLSK